MTKEEFKKYVLTQLSIEEAFDRFLDAGLIHYEKLKFNQGEEIHPLILISMAAMDMGWIISIEKEGVSKEVRGVSVGTKEYFDMLLK